MKALPVVALVVVSTSFFAACGDDTGTGGGADTSGASTASSASSNSGAATTAATSGSTAAQTSSATGAQADTWTSFAQGFMTTYCHECHGPGDPVRDYSLLATVVDESAEIRCGTAKVNPGDCTGFPPPKQFPVNNGAGNNPKPTDAERDRLQAWIEAGLPE